MKVAQITSHGLATIAVLVAVLWGCILLENRIVRQARIANYQTLRAIQNMQLQRKIQPVTLPAPPKVFRKSVG